MSESIIICLDFYNIFLNLQKKTENFALETVSFIGISFISILTSTMRTMVALARPKLFSARQENSAESFIFTWRIMSLDTVTAAPLPADRTSFLI